MKNFLTIIGVVLILLAPIISCYLAIYWAGSYNPFRDMPETKLFAMYDNGKMVVIPQGYRIVIELPQYWIVQSKDNGVKFITRHDRIGNSSLFIFNVIDDGEVILTNGQGNHKETYKLFIKCANKWLPAKNSS